MKKLLFISLALLMCIGSSWAVRLSGERYMDKRFEGRTINALEASSMWQIELEQGGTTGISIDVPSELAEYVECRLDGDRLILAMNNRPKSLNNIEGETRMTARITVSSLRDLSVCMANVRINSPINNGSLRANVYVGSMGKVTTDGDLQCAGLNVTLTSTGHLELQSVECNGDVRIECSSMSDLDIRGQLKCHALSASLFGASKANTNGIQCSDNAQIECSSMSVLTEKGTLACQKFAATLAGASHAKMAKIESTGDARIECSSMSQMATDLTCNGLAEFGTYGSSELNVKGSAQSARINSSSMSRYYGSEFIAPNVNVVCSGSSNAKVYIDEEGNSNIDCSSMANVIVYGRKAPQQHQVRTSNSGQITYL